MNLELHHKSGQFAETHPTSLKELPLQETVDALVSTGRDSIVLRFEMHAREPKQFIPCEGFGGQHKPALKRWEKYVCARGAVVELVGRWKSLGTTKEIVEDAGGTKHEEIRYGGNFYVLEGAGSTIVLRMQRLEDEVKLNAFPKDQQLRFKARWTGDLELSATLASVRIAGVDPLDDEIVKLQALDVADLQTLAPMVGVRWDEKASLDTMVKRIAEKRLAKRAKAAEKPEGAAKPEPQLQNA